jgi:hypothetical protein
MEACANTISARSVHTQLETTRMAQNVFCVATAQDGPVRACHHRSDA